MESRPSGGFTDEAGRFQNLIPFHVYIASTDAKIKSKNIEEIGITRNDCKSTTLTTIVTHNRSYLASLHCTMSQMVSILSDNIAGEDI